MNAKRAARVLIADDERSIRFVLRETLEEAGHQVTEATSGDEALKALAAESFDLAFFDIRMPGPSGLDLLDHLRAIGSETAVVIITAQNTFENAVEAMKKGALDYLVKPFRMTEVMALTEKAMRALTLQREVESLRKEVSKQGVPSERLVGKSPLMLDIFKTIGKVASSEVSVMITGESGTGKELVARAIHNASSRTTSPFSAINTAAIPRELLESELFGHERGAFTGAVDARAGRFREASGGTLFLDEIGDMPLDLQAKILRVLQTGEVTPLGGSKSEKVDVRIVAATHHDLEEDVRNGRFREDLLFRLRVIPIEIPALRDRPEDIPALVDHFLGRYSEELTGSQHWVADETLEQLIRFSWPGNVRELENAIKRALVLATGDVLIPDDFDFLDNSVSSGSSGSDIQGLVQTDVRAQLDGPETGTLYRDWITRIEKPLIETVLHHTGGNQIRTAAILGINRNTLRKKIVELEIALPERS
ncbi:MAG: sigma-54-dependent Fis family transcriptional regulator [Deltaproteobacteria bacterium]|nr:sigma-54-dependent Fis family transcriptional regulator [Deltaproteobacteria bacterium]